MKKKGQALVEFIIILPIFLLLLLGVFDIGRILYTKIKLEDEIGDVVNLYEAGHAEEEIKEKIVPTANIKIENGVEYTNLKLSKDIEILTPGLNLVFKNPYKIEVSRSILNE